MDLYNKHRGIGSGMGLTLLPKLKMEHISLTSYSKMRVDLAVQVIINRMIIITLASLYMYIGVK